MITILFVHNTSMTFIQPFKNSLKKFADNFLSYRQKNRRIAPISRW